MTADTHTSNSLYMRYTDKDGASHVMEHRVWDAERFVRSVRAQAAKDGGITLTRFVRLEVGEGIEREDEDFAAEVAKMARN